ncbi:Acg family FMN-binding oxidoreductase [Mycolicibacterium sp. 050158]|uniref:Acg family FMN-binding oxidoreductase n=1 Tax=Mycolicibacterium sp. 050158 TaxID=3090602 RepID=UPI00299F412E|nr:NAD(P)H nitroreductase [Mycolicibacterium sp. 050158]MDX1890800.1 NAD(P)H nitroreductase [Mycolicibacterium sp. 050158]
MPYPVVSSGVIADAVHLACRAPSIHNSQPWRFVGQGAGVLHLYLDRDRLVDSDSSARQALLSCGAVLDHLRVAMAAQGWTANVDYYPNPNDHLHLASIDFTPMSYVTDGHRRRAKAILVRRTDRLPFAAPANWDEFEPLLRRAVDENLAILDVLPEQARPQLAEASQLTESMRLYDSPYHAELDWWTGPFADHDGIPHSSLVSAAESDRVDIGRTFPVTHHRERRPDVPEDRSTVLVLSALGESRRDILTCGEALSVTLLEATMAGLATCPLTHLTEIEASREIVGELTGRRLPQVLVRVGVVPAMDEVPPPTPRRTLSEVLTWRPSVAAHVR